MTRPAPPPPPEHSVLLGGADDAVTLRARLLARELTVREVAEALLAAIGPDHLHAWTAVPEPQVLLARATALDQLEDDRRRRLPLFGVPVAIKDLFDTVDLPTAYGSPIYAGHRPLADADAVRRLLAAGALIAGKTKLSELGCTSPTDALNPLDPTRTPGGSSTGSAVAVAARTVPLATGTQTAGSIGRPASYCGVLGYKPTFGLLSGDGVKSLAPALDTVGLLARSVPDLRLATRVLAGHPPREPPAPPSPAPPHIGLARTLDWDRVDPPARAAIEALAEAAAAAGARVEEIELPPGFAELTAAQATIQWFETAASLAPERADHPDLLSPDLRAALDAGAAIAPADYADAKRAAAELAPPLVELLTRHDCLLTPSTTGVPPPRDLGSTGDSHFCRAWTLVGAPTISVPLAWTTPDHLPAGAQVVSAPHADARALAAAAWLLDHIGRPPDMSGHPCGR